MFDMMKMMGKVKEVQEKMKGAQEELGQITAEAESGGGMVKVVVNGRKEVISLDIDDSLYGDADKDFMKDLIIAAINIGIANVDAKAKEHMQKATEGIMPNIPGMDLSKMM